MTPRTDLKSAADAALAKKVSRFDAEDAPLEACRNPTRLLRGPLDHQADGQSPCTQAR